MPDFTYEQIAKMIDHSLLQQQLTDADLEAGIVEPHAPRGFTLSM